MPDAEPQPCPRWGQPAFQALAALMAALSGFACSTGEAMTPDRAQATVTAFAAQTTATAAAKTLSEQNVASATAAARSGATAAVERTATAAVQATATLEAQSTATGIAAATATGTAVAGAATATAKAQPTATRTPVPTVTPTPGPRFPAAVGGQGEIMLANGAASFGFGVGRREDGKVEGWLQYGSGRGTLRGLQFARLDTYLGTAGFWGAGMLPDLPDTVTFNVNLVSTGQNGGPGSFHIVVLGANGQQLFAEGGPVARGAINVSGP